MRPRTSDAADALAYGLMAQPHPPARRVRIRAAVIKIGDGFLFGLGFCTAGVVVLTLWGAVLPW